jgi:hypothetical protein
MTGARVHPFDLVVRVLAERLRGCAASEQLRRLARSRGIDWERVVGQASAQFVLPAFAAALKDLGLIESLDPDLGVFLEAVHAANIERNSELRAELGAAVGVLNRVGIEPVLLKGAIRLLDGLYPDDGWRMLRDLDLLVPEVTLAEANQALADAGYEACGSGGEIRRRGGVCQIDLHTEVFSIPRHLRLLQAQEILDGARPLPFGDGRVRVPALEHQLVHLIGHSQVRHFGHAIGRIGLHDRLEAAALARWAPEPIDWQALCARFSTAGYRRPLLSFLLALKHDPWCAVGLTDQVDAVVALQSRRIALQTRSPTLAYVGARVGWWVSAIRSQIAERDGGERKGIRNFKSLLSERGAIRRLARGFLDRRSHLVYLLPYLIWLVAR